jgi:hypothetical protein
MGKERARVAMNTHSGEAIARAIACASRGGAAVALVNALGGDVPDDTDAADLAHQLAGLTEGLTAGEAMGEALAVGILAGRELARAFELCDDAAALQAEACQAVRRGRELRRRYP